MPVNTKWRKFTKSPARNLGLQVGEKIFWVSRRRLANLSPVFEAMLFGDFQEATKEVVKLSDKDPGDILEMLRCLFPTQGQGKKRKPIDDGNFDLLLRLADEYQIKALTEKCSKFWGRKMAGKCIGEIVGLIDQANQYKLKGAVRVGLRELSKFNPSTLLKDSDFTGLPMNMRLAIAIIAWFRESQPQEAHEYLDDDDYYEWPRHWREDPIHAGGERCMYCGYEKCTPSCCHKFRADDEGQDPPLCDPICRTCDEEYGSTDFVCKCIDPEIEAELKKLGL